MCTKNCFTDFLSKSLSFSSWGLLPRYFGTFCSRYFGINYLRQLGPRRCPENGKEGRSLADFWRSRHGFSRRFRIRAQNGLPEIDQKFWIFSGLRPGAGVQKGTFYVSFTFLKRYFFSTFLVFCIFVKIWCCHVIFPYNYRTGQFCTCYLR